MIEHLTPEQEAKMADYTREGIEIGLATGPDFDEEEVLHLTNAHRVQCGLPPVEKLDVFDSPFAACRSIEGLRPGNALYGQHDINWLQFYQFFRQELGLKKETQPIVHLYELAKRVGWMWMNGERTVVTRRSEEIYLANKAGGFKVLHNLDDKAVRYRDGWGLYALNGIRIPADFTWIVTTPADQLDPEQVLGITNVELRGEAVKKIGMTKMLDRLESKVLHTYHCDIGGDYELHQIQLGENTRIYLKMTCPSKGEMTVEAVPPTIKTCQEALTWREWGTVSIPTGYLPPLVRT